MNIKDDEILISDENNKEFVMKILFTYTNEERNTNYVFLYDEKYKEDIYVMKYDEFGELNYVEDEEELEEANEVLSAYNDDPMIEQIK